MSIDAMKTALEALENGGRIETNEAITALRQAIEQTEKQEPVAQMLYRYGDEWRLNEPNWDGWDFDECMPFYTAPPQRQPLTDSVREMRDVQGRDGTWNYDPYMHGLYNGLEFAVSLLEQREPQFKDAPEKWLCDLPKPRIFSDAHGIGGEA